MNKRTCNLFATHRLEQTVAYIGEKPVLFAEFVGDVDVLASQLAQHSGDVLISCQSRYAFSVALLATWQVNKVAILLPHNQTMLNKASASFEIAKHCDDAWAKVCRQAAHAHTKSPCCFPATQLAIRLYTSGSTGEPQLVEKTLGSLWCEVESLGSSLDWLSSAVLASVPAYHLYGLTFSVLLPWCLGVPLIDEMPLHADEVTACFAQTGAEIFITVPIHLKALMDTGVALNNKQCIVSAASLPKQSAQAFRAHYHADALEIYGSSETGIIAYRKQLIDAAWACFPQVDIAVDEQGLLQVSSPFLYEQALDHAAEKVFHSFDKVVLHDRQSFTLEGRMDAIVKIAGKRISILHIEQSLMRCHGIEDAAVVAVPAQSAVRDWSIWAAIAVKDEESCDIAAIKQELRVWVDGVAIPRRMRCLARLPREPNGKLTKKMLMAIFSHV